MPPIRRPISQIHVELYLGQCQLVPQQPVITASGLKNMVPAIADLLALLTCFVIVLIVICHCFAQIVIDLSLSSFALHWMLLVLRQCLCNLIHHYWFKAR